MKLTFSDHVPDMESDEEEEETEPAGMRLLIDCSIQLDGEGKQGTVADSSQGTISFQPTN